jgi:hypothetical protein
MREPKVRLPTALSGRYRVCCARANAEGFGPEAPQPTRQSFRNVLLARS